MVLQDYIRCCDVELPKCRTNGSHSMWISMQQVRVGVGDRQAQWLKYSEAVRMCLAVTNCCSLFESLVCVSCFLTGEENLLAILKRRWWKYMILGLIDIEANYLVIKAYQYTTLTSVQVRIESPLIKVMMISRILLLTWE